MADKKKVDTKYLILRSNGYTMSYRYPKKLLAYPQFQTGSPFFTKKLDTDSLTRARLARDIILARFNSVLLGDGYEAWKETIDYQAKQFISGNIHIEHYKGEADKKYEADEVDEADEARYLYRSMATEQILDSAIKSSGYKNDDSGRPHTITPTQQIQLDILAGRIPKKHSGLLHISKLAMAEKKRKGRSDATLIKIKSAVRWLLLAINKSDIQLTELSRRMIKTALDETDVSGNTKAGHIVGLRAVWSYAVDHELISDDIKNPTVGHKNSLLDQQSHDPYTQEEIYQLWNAATGELRQLIHIAATSGARISELYSIELENTSKEYNKPTWAIMQKSAGKNESARRVIPVHHSIDIDKYKPYQEKLAALTYQFGKLVDRELGIRKVDRTERIRKLTFHSIRTSVIDTLHKADNANHLAIDAMVGHKQTQAKIGSAFTYLHSASNRQAVDRAVQSIVWNP
jgi:hypothetical protein